MNNAANGVPRDLATVYTVSEFCTAHKISRNHLDNLVKAGKGPRLLRLGRRVLITHEAASAWRAEQEVTA